MIKVLNLGCGRDIKISNEDKEWTNVDKIDLSNVKFIDCGGNIGKYIQCDLENNLPFEDNTFDEVYASHVLEHINNFIGLMDELHRICKNDAIIRIKVPYFASSSAFQDPTHIRFFTLKTFNYFLEENPNSFITSARFKIIKRYIRFTRKNWIINKPLEFLINNLQSVYERLLCFIIPFQEANFDLKVVK
jgi:SAM-dependent methyltransferase